MFLKGGIMKAYALYNKNHQLNLSIGEYSAESQFEELREQVKAAIAEMTKNGLYDGI